jgi:hypothetical protein
MSKSLCGGSCNDCNAGPHDWQSSISIDRAVTPPAAWLVSILIAAWAAWEAARLLTWALCGLFGTKTGWLVLAPMIAGGGLLLLGSDPAHPVWWAFACVGAAMLIVSMVEQIERQERREARQRAYEQGRRTRDEAETRAGKARKERDDEAGGVPLDTKFVDGIWVVADSAEPPPASAPPGEQRSRSPPRLSDGSAGCCVECP